jgi:hypothetical protein
MGKKAEAEAVVLNLSKCSDSSAKGPPYKVVEI